MQTFYYTLPPLPSIALAFYYTLPQLPSIVLPFYYTLPPLPSIALAIGTHTCLEVKVKFKVFGRCFCPNQT